MASEIKRTIYRDKLTGRFASKKTYNRNRSHGGKRYVKQRIAYARKLPFTSTGPALLPFGVVQTYFATFRYTNSHGTRQFDFIVRASSVEEVRFFIAGFVKGHPKFEVPGADNIFERLDYFGWSEPPKIIAIMTPEEFPEYNNKPKGFVEYQ